MSEKNIREEFEFSENSMTVSQALENPKSGFRNGLAERFIKIQAPLYDKEENEFVINRVYSMACNFEGHEDSGLDEDHIEYVDPLDIPLQDLLDFFSAGDDIWNKSHEELQTLTFFNPIKKKLIKNLRDSVGYDMERVAEAVALSIAEKVSEKNPKLSRLLGRFDGSVGHEKMAELNQDSALMNYASTVNNTNDDTPAIIAMGRADDLEVSAERKRVRLTNQILETIEPELEDLNLLNPIKEWLNFSNN